MIKQLQNSLRWENQKSDAVDKAVICILFVVRRWIQYWKIHIHALLLTNNLQLKYENWGTKFNLIHRHMNRVSIALDNG